MSPERRTGERLVLRPFATARAKPEVAAPLALFSRDLRSKPGCFVPTIFCSRAWQAKPKAAPIRGPRRTARINVTSVVGGWNGTVRFKLEARWMRARCSTRAAECDVRKPERRLGAALATR